jgi:mannose-6-phosphate isomerase-like protein (cupin superfamily)
MTLKQSGETSAFPYATHLNVLFEQLQTIDVPSLASKVSDQWYNQTLCKVNESVVRLGVMQGEYHWHKHDDDDEFFFCLDGSFIVELEGRSVTLGPLHGFLETTLLS